MKMLVVVQGLALIGITIFGAEFAHAASSCKQTIVHSRNQNLGEEDLNTRNIEEIFLPPTGVSQCSYYSSSVISLLSKSCADKAQRGLGLPAKSQIKFQFISGGVTTLIRTYTAFCQDLVPQFYSCSYWDKAQNMWVSTPTNPDCVPGDGGGGGGEGGSP